MIIEKLPRYERDIKKLMKSYKLTINEIEDAEKLFLENRHNPLLRYHKIISKKDKDRYSLSIPNKSYRILISDLGDIVKFNALLSHKEYDRINKNC